jgi:hypothetical protein
MDSVNGVVTAGMTPENGERMEKISRVVIPATWAGVGEEGQQTEAAAVERFSSASQRGHRAEEGEGSRNYWQQTATTAFAPCDNVLNTLCFVV